MSESRTDTDRNVALWSAINEYARAVARGRDELAILRP